MSHNLQVLDTGHGVPKHPLFFLGWKHSAVVTADAEADVDGKETPEDVKKEAARVDLLAQVCAALLLTYPSLPVVCPSFP